MEGVELTHYRHDTFTRPKQLYPMKNVPVATERFGLTPPAPRSDF
jgi:hypothetical protein